MLHPQKHRLPEVLALSDLKEHKDGKLKGLPMFDNVRHQFFSCEVIYTLCLVCWTAFSLTPFCLFVLMPVCLLS